MDYNNYNNYNSNYVGDSNANTYSNYQMQQQMSPQQGQLQQQPMMQQPMMQQPMMQQQSMGKKRDVKGIIMTAICMVTALITALSTLMPMVSVALYNYKSEGYNIIDITKGAVEAIDSTVWRYLSGWEIFTHIITIIMLFVPILIALVGVITAVVYIIKLATLKPTRKVNGFAKEILAMEMMFAAYLYYHGYAAAYVDGSTRYSLQNMSLSVGWYLPVIFAVCTMFLNYIFNVIDKAKGAEKSKGYIITGIFGFIGAIASIFMYLAFGFSQFSYTGNGVKDITFGVLNVLMLEELEAIPICICAFIFIITVLSCISFTQSIKKPLQAKFSGVWSIVAGVIIIALAITNYILIEIFMEESSLYQAVHMGTSSILYIVMGSILIILGIAYLCVKAFLLNDKPVNTYNVFQQQPMMQQPMIQQQVQNMGYYQQPMAQQPMVQQVMPQQSMVQQPMAQQVMEQQPMASQPADIQIAQDMEQNS